MIEIKSDFYIVFFYTRIVYYELTGDPSMNRLENNIVVGDDVENVSDGYHTFDELYRFRMLYNAGFFNLLAKLDECEVYKSEKHYDGEYPFGENKMFIVSAMLPTGLISNHYSLEYWDLFKVRAVDKSIFEYDGHDSSDVVSRITRYLESM